MMNMNQGFKNIATRITNAEQSFIEYAMNHGLTHDQAVHALNVYRKVKAIKIDAIGGQFTFTHGAYGDADVLKNTINYKL